MTAKIGRSLALVLITAVVAAAAVAVAPPQAQAAGWTIDPDGRGP